MFMMESVFFIYKIAIIIFAAHSDMKKNIKFVLISQEALRETFTAYSIF